MEEEVFELVFEGAVDSSPDTVRRLKTACIADLNMSIEQARDLVSGNKATILRTTDRTLVDSYFDILTKAGGKLLIVQPNAEQKVSTEPFHKDEELWNEDFGYADNLVPHMPDDVTNVLDLDLGLKPSTEEEKVSNTIETTSTEKIVSLLESVEEELTENKPVENKPQAPESKPKDEPPASYSFSFADEGTEAHAPPPKIEIPEPTPAPKTATVDKSKIKDFDFSFSDSEESHTETPAPVKALPKDEIKNTPTSSIPSFSLDDVEEEKKGQTNSPVIKEMPKQEEPKKAVESKVAIEEPKISPPTLPVQEAKPSLNVQSPEKDEVHNGDNEQSVSETEEELPVIRRKKQSAMKSYLEMGIPILLGTTILFVGNWYYFSRDPAAPLPEAESAAEILARKNKAPKKEPTIDPTTIAINLQGETKDENVILTGSFVIEKETFKEFTVILTTPEPPALTNEEIVNNAKRAPWIEKITIEEPDITYEGNGRFKASTPAKVIIEEQGDRSRNVATAELRGMLSSSQKQVIVEVSIKSQIEGNPSSNPFIERMETGGYRYWIHGRLEVKPQ